MAPTPARPDPAPPDPAAGTVAGPGPAAWSPPFPPPPVQPTRTERRADALGQGVLTVVGVGTGLLALRAIGIHAPSCPFRTATGVPCPGCGITRLADALVHGRVASALTADPAGVVLLVALFVVAGTYAVRRVQRQPLPRWLHSRAVPILLVALLGIHWITTLVTGGLPSS